MTKGRQTVHLPQKAKKHDKSDAKSDASSSNDKTNDPQSALFKDVRKALTTALPLLAIAALASPASQRTLAPIYGAIPSSVNHAQAITATVMIGYIWRSFLKSSDDVDVLAYLALWAFWLPAFQQYLTQYSTALGPLAGPIVQGFLSCHTIIIASGYVVAQALEPFDLQDKLGHIGGVAIPAIALDLLYFRPVEYVLAHFALPWLDSMTPLLTPVTLQILVAVGIACLSRSKPYWLFTLAAPAMLHAFLANPHFDGPYNLAIANRDLTPHNWTLLDRSWSNTGYISVLECQTHQYRVLRCDHSLLGGEWLLTTERQTKGWQVNEPIYAVFQMLEAVRLIHREAPVADSAAQALVVGLGVGTAPKALMAHGIYTTVLEIDPAVHRFAKQYFGLPSDAASGQVHIADAVGWAAQAVEAGEKKYEYIIHDVFTGGAEPLALFTDAFLQNLRALLTDDGVIALNYAGDLSLPLTARILNTIDQVFEGQCKIFRDEPASPDAAKEDFLNLVIFCRNRPGDITFRKPTRKAYLGSKSRENYLLPKAELEIAFPLRAKLTTEERVEEMLRIGDEGKWQLQQEQSAIRHWHIMRRVLPAGVWEIW